MQPTLASPIAPPPHDLEQLIRAHQTGVWRYLRTLGCDAGRADDLTQDTFVQAIAAGLEDRGTAATGSFLRETARYVYLRSRRRAARRSERELAAAAEKFWARQCAADDGDGLLEALRACAAQLQDKAARAVQLQYADGRSRAELAEILGLTTNGVRTLLQRTRQWLRDCIERKTHG